MTCKTCGFRNNSENKFCINCGEKLLLTENPDLVYCSVCGAKNKSKDEFCTSCGKKLVGKKDFSFSQKKAGTNKVKRYKRGDQNKKTSVHKKNSLNLFWIITGLLIIVAFLLPVINYLNNSSIQDKQGFMDFKNIDPVIEAGVIEIASKFVCSCGSCNQESLDVCKCERAKEEREFIRTRLKNNEKNNNIILAVANAYGWMKSEYASGYNIDPAKVWYQKKDLIDEQLIPQADLNTAVATKNLE